MDEPGAALETRAENTLSPPDPATPVPDRGNLSTFERKSDGASFEASTSEAVVAGCRKVGQVEANAATASPDVKDELTAAARSQRANYVLLASEGARTGVAYRCETPTAPGAASMTPGGSSK